MSAFDQGPQNDDLSQAHGPVLVVPPQQPKPSKWELWRRRIFLIVFVLFCLEIGIILTVAPWTSFWLQQLADFELSAGAGSTGVPFCSRIDQRPWDS